MQPIRFEPILKRAIWGGQRLGTLLGKSIGPEGDYAESWEISDLPGNVSVVSKGSFKGQTLHELIASHREELLGSQTASQTFPLLIKFLDAHRVLSVQVHPSAEMAASRPEVTTGKAEAWVILEADPGARIFAGLKSGVDEPVLRRAIEAQKMDDVLHQYAVKKGDCIFLRPGTVHALGAGLLVAEIQQPNDVTYRLYDWARVGLDGRPRELHLDMGIEATNFSFGEINPVVPTSAGHPTREVLVSSEFFHVHRVTGPATVTVPHVNRAVVLMGIEGSSAVHAEQEPCMLARGSTLLLPADRGQVEIVCPEGAVVLEAFLPACV